MECTDDGGVREVGSVEGDRAGDEDDVDEDGADDSLLAALLRFLLALLSSSSPRLRFSLSFWPPPLCEEGSGCDCM